MVTGFSRGVGADEFHSLGVEVVGFAQGCEAGFSEGFGQVGGCAEVAGSVEFERPAGFGGRRGCDVGGEWREEPEYLGACVEVLVVVDLGVKGGEAFRGDRWKRCMGLRRQGVWEKRPLDEGVLKKKALEKEDLPGAYSMCTSLPHAVFRPSHGVTR